MAPLPKRTTCKQCLCEYAMSTGWCPACAEDTNALRLNDHAQTLTRISKAFTKEKAVESEFVPALEAGIAALRDSRRNHQHVAKILRSTPPLGL